MNLLNYAFSQYFMYFWICLKFLCSWLFSFYFGSAILKWGLLEWNFQTLHHGQNSPIVFQFCPIFWKIIWSPCWCNEACFNLILKRFLIKGCTFDTTCILEIMNIEVSCCNYPYHVFFLICCAIDPTKSTWSACLPLSPHPYSDAGVGAPQKSCFFLVKVDYVLVSFRMTSWCFCFFFRFLYKSFL